MDLPLSAAVVPRLVWLTESPSTNPALVAAASGPDRDSWPDRSVLVTDNQTQGKGRLGRSWAAPAGTSLAISVLLRTGAGSRPIPVESLGWLPLLAGVAMSRAINSILDAAASSAESDARGERLRASVKWPNDVLIGRAKVSGILSEMLPNANGVVIGAGVNLFLTEDQLPVPTATSIALAGGGAFTADEVLAAYLGSLSELYGTFSAAGGDAVSSGIAEQVAAACSTLGEPVAVELPGSDVVRGRATGLDESGRLIVVRDADAQTFAVSAGDVTHLRY